MDYAKKALLFSGAMIIAYNAQADDVTFYGVMSASVESASATGASNGGATKPSQMRIEDDNSRIGIRGSDDLDNGLKAIWQVESGLRDFAQGGTTDWGQSATLATRNTFIGLQDARYGKFIVGYNDNAYKSLVGGVTDFGINVMASTTADNWGSGPGYYSIFSRGETRMKNSMHYTSPVVDSLQFAASYGFDESTTDSASGVDKSRYDLAGKYVLGGWKLGVGWDHQNDTAGYATSSSGKTGKSTNYYKLISSYKFDEGTLIGAGIERGTYDATTSGTMSQTGWTVAASQALAGKWGLNGSYSRLGSLSHPTAGSPDDYKATQWVVGTTYALSRRTSLFAFYTRITNGAEQNVNFGFNPVVTSTNEADTVALADGSTVRAIGVGMTTSF